VRWTLDDIKWDAFDASKVDSGTLEAAKAAALVEFNAPDYVSYLCNVFADSSEIQDNIRQWGREEAQHGRALARWARLADPSFDFDSSFERFRRIQGIQTDAIESVRGSRAGEMIARCVVESGTSSFYTAIKDATEEPVLRQIATYLAADEFAHYKLFYDSFRRYQGELPTVWQRLRIAVGRIDEADDDELSGAFYCANYPAGSAVAYDRRTFADAYQRRALGVYRRQHIDRLISMVAKAGGLRPHGWLVRAASAVAWQVLSFKQRRLARHAV
jgi:rubrerythrin